jgi:hypothetical protein
MPGFASGFFPLVMWRGFPVQAQHALHSGDDAHHDTESVGKGLLNDMTRGARSGLAVVFELLLHGFAQFGRMSMSATL